MAWWDSRDQVPSISSNNSQAGTFNSLLNLFRALKLKVRPFSLTCRIWTSEIDNTSSGFRDKKHEEGDRGDADESERKRRWNNKTEHAFGRRKEEEHLAAESGFVIESELAVERPLPGADNSEWRVADSVQSAAEGNWAAEVADLVPAAEAQGGAGEEPEAAEAGVGAVRAELPEAEQVHRRPAVRHRKALGGSVEGDKDPQSEREAAEWA